LPPVRKLTASPSYTSNQDGSDNVVFTEMVLSRRSSLEQLDVHSTVAFSLTRL